MFIADNFGGSLQILGYLSLAIFFYWLWTRRYLYIFSLRVPGYWGLPFFGHFHKIRNISNLTSSITETFKELNQDTFCLWFGLTPNLVTRDYQLIDKILTSKHLRNRADVTSESVKEIVGIGLLTTEDSQWQRNRKLINPFFHQKILQNLIPIINRSKDSLINDIRENKSQEGERLYWLIQRSFVGTATEIILADENYDVSDLENYVNNSVRMKMELMWRGAAKNLRCDSFYNFTKKTKTFLSEYIHKRVRKGLEKRQNMDTTKEVATPKNFLDYIIKFQESKQLTENEICGEAHSLFETMFESLSICVFSTLVMLAMHPEVQEKLFKEIENVFPDKKNLTVNYEHFQQMPYLNMVLNESMRVIPPVPIMNRKVTQDIEIGNWKLPKGLDIYMSFLDLNHRKDIWGPDADKFNPDNFLPENLTQKPPNSFLPFSKGVRNCVGFQYANQALKIVMPSLVRNFELTTNYKYENLRFTVHLATKFLELPKLNITERK